MWNSLYYLFEMLYRYFVGYFTYQIDNPETVVEVEMLEEILLDALATFGVTLVITKSSLFASKREYVSRRWPKPRRIRHRTAEPAIHYFWFKMHTCAMCLACGCVVLVGPTIPFWRGLLAYSV
jgi:NADH:ubiquinone oxidoreductase subunit 5 (subunit L)/multisubunit Na+/H+ antiporter MnhA subunit